MDGPDLEGFRDAQITLREQFSQPVEFFTPTATTWPSGTQIDPETGVPYDPTIAPTASGYSTVTASAEVFRGQGAARTVAEEVATAIGELETGEAVLAIDPADLADIQGSDFCEFDGEEWRITAAKDSDAIGPLDPDRVLIWVERR